MEATAADRASSEIVMSFVGRLSTGGWGGRGESGRSRPGSCFEFEFNPCCNPTASPPGDAEQGEIRMGYIGGVLLGVTGVDVVAVGVGEGDGFS